MEILTIILCAVIITTTTLPTILGAKILGVFVFPSRSHAMVFRPIMRELVKRGHEVTIVTNYRIDEKITNYKEIIIEPQYDFIADIKQLCGVKGLSELADISVMQMFEILNLIGKHTVEYAINSDRMQNLIHNSEENFDLVILEQYYQDALLILGHQYRAPVITISAQGYDTYFGNILGLMSPWSHIPQAFLPYTDRMTFSERISNTLNSLYAEYNRKYKFHSDMDGLIAKYFSHLGGADTRLPSVFEMEKNISLVLINNYLPLDIPRPYALNGVLVGGVHIMAPKTLPRDVKLFLDNSRNGAVLFSLGTTLSSSDFSPEIIQTLIKVFGKLKVNVLWKWENENVPNLPKNVMIKKWLPQADVLAHPHLKLFASHGGLLSVQESIFRSIPILGIPIYYDQHLNLKKATDAGYALTIKFSNISESSLLWAFNELLYDSKYYLRMREVSQIFRDRPASAIETSIYWIEYILKYRGAPHIRSAGRELPWYKFYLLDVILLFTIVFTVSLITFIIFIVCLVRKYSDSRKMKLIESKKHVL